MGLFTLKLKSCVGCNVGAGVYTWTTDCETRSFLLSASVSSPRTVTGFLKSSYTNSTQRQTIHRGKCESCSRVQHSHLSRTVFSQQKMWRHSQRKPSPLQLRGWGNDAKVMQARSQLRYKVAIWERSANPSRSHSRSWQELCELA